MSDDPLSPLPRDSSPVPARPAERPPMPGWMWWWCGLGPFALCLLVGMATTPSNGLTMEQGALAGGLCGTILSGLLLGGLALSAKFFNGTAGRIAGAVMFAFALAFGVLAVGFAGCMCVMMQK